MKVTAATLLIIGGIAGLIAVGSAILFAWQNVSSQTIVLSVAAFCGAFILLGVQLFLVLKHGDGIDLVTAEYTLDKKLPEMASAFYSEEYPGVIRGPAEKDISAAVAKSNPAVFNDPPESLAQDMTVASLFLMFFRYQPDWQIRPVTLRPRYTFGLQGFEKLSPENECTKIFANDVKAKLAKTGNVFSNVDLERSYKHICLPPNAKLSVERHEVKIETPPCTVIFQVKSPHGKLYGEPMLIQSGQAREIRHENLIDGNPRYINMPVPIEIRVEYHALYATHRDMDKYKTWVSTVNTAAHSWFEGSGHIFNKYRSPLETDNDVAK